MAFTELKARQSVVWGDGPYERITNTLRDVHALVVARMDPKSGERVLDVATGTGAVALVAAERDADVVGVDLAPALVDTARALAVEKGVTARFDVGDAEAMPYEDESFDVVLSTFGVMFAPDHHAVAHELARVARRGGRIALASWTPESQMLEMMGPFLPAPPAGVGNPFDWGRADHVQDLLADAFELRFEKRTSPLVVDSGEACWELFTTSYGPTKAVTEALESHRREEFRRAWIDFFEAQREGDKIVHQREYLLALGTRRH